MTKAEIVNEISKQTGIDKVTVLASVEAFMAAVKDSLEKVTKRVEFVTFDANKLSGTYARYPERNELNMDIDESLIVEFYNK